MYLSFHGAAQTVTGSQHLLEFNGTKILLDCGMYQGRRKDMLERNRHFPFDPQSIDAVILSHAHIDHSGNLPNLVNQGYRGRIYATPATIDLCAAMLPDSGHIQERNAEYVNKHRGKNDPEAEPIYTEEDARYALQFFSPVPYHESVKVAPGVWLTFIDAGHMLGSATVILEIEESHQPMRRLVFSGDIGRHGIPIIRDPQPPAAADFLIMEATYGGRTHPPYEDTTHQLKALVEEAMHNGGVLLIPAFAVGRTQQIVVQLNELFERGELPRIPVYVDSPLALNATEVFRKHPECYDYALETFLYESKDDDPFGFETLTYIRDTEESKALNSRHDPMVIISASGMMEFGRVVHHLRNRIQDPQNILLITGWQAPQTLGRKMAEHTPYVRILGHEHKNRMKTVVMDAFSGHADHNELLAWFEQIEHKPKRVFLVHTEPEAADALKAALQERYPQIEVDIPHMNQKFKLG